LTPPYRASDDLTGLPISAPGMRIGLFGGSFNPAHEGHCLVTREVMRRLGLDAVWWLVSPGNPLKDNTDLPPLAARIAAARRLASQKRVWVTGFEAAYGFRYTFDTLSHLKSRLPGRKLVWIMGADNLAGFHRWEHWREVAGLLPFAVYVRPGATRRAMHSPAASALAHYRIDETDAALLPDLPAPAWVYLNGIMSGLSSSAIRAAAIKQDR
jgi:nicotinate-nucleotide adenylyltransferase